MALRYPGGLQTIKQISDSATSGTVAYPFLIPQDTDNIVVKFYTGATFTGTTPTLDVYLQTSDDGGTTWYDVANLGQVTAAVSAQNARFASAATIKGGGEHSQIIGSVAASTTATGLSTGLPLLSSYARIYLKYGGTQLTNSGITVNVYANNQSSRT